jgi:hypothetical protein
MSKMHTDIVRKRAVALRVNYYQFQPIKRLTCICHSCNQLSHSYYYTKKQFC